MRTATRESDRTRSESIATLLRVVIGAVFVLSGLFKVANSDEFEGALAGYDIFSPRVIDILSLLVPHLEITVGTLFAFGLKTELAGVLLVLQLIVFSAPGTIAYAQGRAIDCGCFPVPGSVQPIGPGFFVRNVLLILASIWVVRRLRKGEATTHSSAASVRVIFSSRK